MLKLLLLRLFVLVSVCVGTVEAVTGILMFGGSAGAPFSAADHLLGRCRGT